MQLRIVPSFSMLIKDVRVGNKNVLTESRSQCQYDRQEQAAKQLSTSEPKSGCQRVPEKIYAHLQVLFHCHIRDYIKKKPVNQYRYM